ncbi:MAG: PfkB family carbohydrate kinase [Candidatus Thorarchaeota archaeon]
MRNKRPTIALGQMVLDTVIHNNQVNHIVNSQLLGGPPSFAGIVGFILSKMYSWISSPLIYAYTCPQAIDLLKTYPEFSKIMINLKLRPKCPQFRLNYLDNKNERILSLKNPPLQFNPKDFNWDLGKPAVAIIGSIFHEFKDPEIFTFLKKRCCYIAFDPQGCFRHLTSERTIEFTYWWDPKIIKNVDCLHVSDLESKLLGFGEDPFKIVDEILETPITSVILTRGRSGAILGFKDNYKKRIFNVPAYLEGKVIDETGAGDIFQFAFVTHLLAFRDEINAAAFATSVTSLFLEQKRPFKALSKNRIQLRQEKIKTQIIES